MTQGNGASGASAVAERHLDDELVEQVFEASADALPTSRIRDAVEMAIEIAEIDQQGARAAIWELRGELETLARMEACLNMSPERATLAMGAALQLAEAELASPEPSLRRCTEEALRWLEGRW